MYVNCLKICQGLNANVLSNYVYVMYESTIDMLSDNWAYDDDAMIVYSH